VYLLFHISAWSSSSDHPPFWKEITHWWITPLSAKVSLNNGVTDWRFFIVIISRTDALFILTWTCLQIRVGNHKTAARETWQTKLWLEGLRNCSAVHCTEMHTSYTRQTSSPQLPFASTCMNDNERNQILSISNAYNSHNLMNMKGNTRE
jgi:hypothetical protein